MWKAAGPALLRIVPDNDPTINVRHHLTAALGMPIAAVERKANDIHGSLGFYFHEVHDENSDPSTKVFGVSNRHVLCKRTKGTFEDTGEPHQYV